MFDSIVCLPGFAGSPADFDFLGRALKEKGLADRYFPVSLYGDAELGPSDSLSSWTKKAKQRFARFERPLFVGYSMGGRLALNLICTNLPNAHALILSARPGIWDPDGIKNREAFDRLWSQRFLDEPREKLAADWNRLPVFEGSKPRPFPPEITNEEMSACFLNWSPRQHLFSFEMLTEKKDSLHWLIGENDIGYHEVFEELCQLEFSCDLVPGAGHRLLDEGKEHILKKFWQIWESEA